MLNTLFYFILNMSIASCFIIAVLLLIRQIRPLPRRVVYPLWALALYRLAAPFALPTRWSLFNFTGGFIKRLVTIETITQGYTVIHDTEPAYAITFMNSIGAADRYIPVEYKTESLHRVFVAGASIWAIIAAAALIAAVALYLFTRKELKQATRIKDNLYRSDMVISPVLTGLFRPRIILPVSLDIDSDEGRMVIAHENMHKTRLDNLWRIFAICITCLHWFNPFAWIMLKAFLDDMELSCDEAVIRKYGAEGRLNYAGTLLKFADEQRMLVSSAFGRSGVKVRIVNVLNYKKLTIAGVLASSALILAIAVVLLTNPVTG